MKNRIIVTTILALLMLACADNSGNELTGKWVLAEMLQDPGDGSGVFEPVISNVYLDIRANEELAFTGIICSFSESDHVERLANYSLQDSSISAMCTNGDVRFLFAHSQDELILSATYCREPCRAKFIRQN